MTLHIERVRTAVLVRNRSGYYRIVYFAHMPRERVLALLPEYGIGAGEVLSVETVGRQETMYLTEGEVATLLMAAAAITPIVADGCGKLTREGVAVWFVQAVQALMPRGVRICPLSDKAVKEIFAIFNSIHTAI